MTRSGVALERGTGCQRVGGVPLDRLAERVGGTPFFAYDRDLLTERVALLRATLPADVDLSYAIKANPMPAVVQHLSGLVDSFDVASAGELRTALDTLTPPERVSFAGPGKSPEELTQAVAAGATIEMESETEVERVMASGDRLGPISIVAPPHARSRRRQTQRAPRARAPAPRERVALLRATLPADVDLSRDQGDPMPAACST